MEDDVVADNDGGTGRFVPISDEAVWLFQQAQAAGVTITQEVEDLILYVIRAKSAWHSLDQEIHARQVQRELNLRGRPIDLIVVQAVMADWRAGVK
jgi:hypothetical protein